MARSPAIRRPTFEVDIKVAGIEVHVPHDHGIGRVPEDLPQPFYVAALAQVGGGEGVAELVGVDPTADLLAGAVQLAAASFDPHRLAP